MSLVSTQLNFIYYLYNMRFKVSGIIINYLEEKEIESVNLENATLEYYGLFKKENLKTIENK